MGLRSVLCSWRDQVWSCGLIQTPALGWHWAGKPASAPGWAGVPACCWALRWHSINRCLKANSSRSVWLQYKRMKNITLPTETISCMVLHLCWGHPSSEVNWNFTWQCRWWHHAQPLTHGGGGWEPSLTLLLLKLLGQDSLKSTFAMERNLPPSARFFLQRSFCVLVDKGMMSRGTYWRKGGCSRYFQ